ncbi:putative alpha/Beta hydrolase [Helianthus anomalus]
MGTMMMWARGTHHYIMLLEHALSPRKPIYLVGDSFGGCLAISVAARNPTLDLVVILVNPGNFFLSCMSTYSFNHLSSKSLGASISATSFERSRLPSLLFLFEALPNVLYGALSLFFLSAIRDLGNFLPKDTLIWRLKLLKSAAAYANSHLQAVTAEVLVLASSKDQLLPSNDEAQRLKKYLQNCVICILKGSDHKLLLKSDSNLLTIIKGCSKYRRTSYHDNMKDYIPPSMSEYRTEYEGHRWVHLATSPVMLSTLEDGKVVCGLGGIPSDGPVLFVGNHMLLGVDLFILFLALLKEKRRMLRGLGHPQMLQLDTEYGIIDTSILLRVFGMLPVSGINLFRLLSSNSYVLLYPGGAREALHRKVWSSTSFAFAFSIFRLLCFCVSQGEVHKLFWPEQQEFVRMAAKCGATIVPFGSVGEDDVSEVRINSVPLCIIFLLIF